MVSPVTARKWAARYQDEGIAGMSDRSSRPRSMPTKTAPAMVKRIVQLRWRRRLGPAQIGGKLGLPASTVHAVLVRCRINRLSRINRVTGEPIRRYEHDHPGSMIYVDVTKFGNIPEGGGWRYVGKLQGDRNRANATDRGGSRHAPSGEPRSCTPSSTTTPASPTSRSSHLAIVESTDPDQRRGGKESVFAEERAELVHARDERDEVQRREAPLQALAGEPVHGHRLRPGSRAGQGVVSRGAEFFASGGASSSRSPPEREISSRRALTPCATPPWATAARR